MHAVAQLSFDFDRAGRDLPNGITVSIVVREVIFSALPTHSPRSFGFRSTAINVDRRHRRGC